jgi:hypothetical protein
LRFYRKFIFQDYSQSEKTQKNSSTQGGWRKNFEYHARRGKKTQGGLIKKKGKLGSVAGIDLHGRQAE